MGGIAGRLDRDIAGLDALRQHALLDQRSECALDFLPCLGEQVHGFGLLANWGQLRGGRQGLAAGMGIALQARAKGSVSSRYSSSAKRSVMPAKIGRASGR